MEKGRYSCGPWHFGFERGPAPCSAPASSGIGGDGVAPRPMPDYVPAARRAPAEARVGSEVPPTASTRSMPGGRP